MRYMLRGLLFAVVAMPSSSRLRSQTPNTDLIGRYSEQGQSALAEGRFSDAAVAFEKLKGLEPGVAEVRANLGAIYFQEQKYDKALPELRQAIKLKPGL